MKSLASEKEGVLLGPKARVGAFQTAEPCELLAKMRQHNAPCDDSSVVSRSPHWAYAS